MMTPFLCKFYLMIKKRTFWKQKPLIYLSTISERDRNAIFEQIGKKVTRLNPLHYGKNAIYANKYCNSYSLNNAIKFFEERAFIVLLNKQERRKI